MPLRKHRFIRTWYLPVQDKEVEVGPGSSGCMGLLASPGNEAWEEAAQEARVWSGSAPGGQSAPEAPSWPRAPIAG